jgi:hypothetical protein
MPGHDDLNAAQLDGLACVVCGMPFVETDEAAVPVGAGREGSCSPALVTASPTPAVLGDSAMSRRAWAGSSSRLGGPGHQWASSSMRSSWMRRAVRR